jgi:hypothetical protein
MIAIDVFLFQSGRANRDLVGGRSTGDDRTAPEGHSASA